MLIQVSRDELKQLILEAVLACNNMAHAVPIVLEPINDDYGFIGAVEAAKLLDISEPTLRKLEKQKVLVPKRIGNRRKYKISWIKDYQAGRKVNYYK